jgi:DNA-directed RNA polymerase subunit alpha
MTLWKGFQKPKRLEVENETLSATYGKFYAQPFERGFGTTVGNALRRVLLSSIEGAAITAVKIEGVLHEFSSLPGVVEDVTDIILNLKQIPIKMHTTEEKILTLDVERKGKVTAADLQGDSTIEILEPDAPIATLSENGTPQHGDAGLASAAATSRADKNFDEDMGIGYIPIDSVHFPVRRVNYHVEAARIGQRTDYDRLVLEVWTNGTVSPRGRRRPRRDAPARSPHDLRQRRARDRSRGAAEGSCRRTWRSTSTSSVDELELSVRSANLL